MATSDTNELQRAIDQHERTVRGLQLSVYSQHDPAGNLDQLARLAQAEKELGALRQQMWAARAALAEQAQAAGADAAPRGRMLGERTTGLRIATRLRMDPLPTGAYHLMDPETDPLLSVDVENVSRETRRVCVKSYIEGLSATAVRTIEVEPRKVATFDLQPTLFPERAQAITVVQRATLHVIVEDLDGKLECHDTRPITCLARTASFNTVRRPDTGELVDLSHYYGAWVTPHVDAVQQRIYHAVELSPDRQLLGYQGDPDQVDVQVAALYQSLRELEIVYFNSVIDYGASSGMTMQRTRLPRESIETRSANCIDGTVLMASLLEGIALNPAIVLVPGHAFVGWERWFGSDEWGFLETTMIGRAEFQAACQSGQRQYEQFRQFSRERLKLHSLKDLRARGIWPMV